MFEPDEIIFTKLAHFFKRRNKQKQQGLAHVAYLKDAKSKLTILARALTGEAIEVYDAEREGGYKNKSFFLPSAYQEFSSLEENAQFYIFRILYLSIQKNENLNWEINEDKSLDESRKAAQEKSLLIVSELKKQYGKSFVEYHKKLVDLYTSLAKRNKEPDFSYIYGKFMQNTKEEVKPSVLKNFSDRVKKIKEEKAKTIISANAVEEMISLQVDKKQLEENILLHQFEKVETAEEFGGNWKDLDGEDELDDHANALEDLNMKHTVRIDDPTHSIYQAEFSENTTIAESAEQNSNAHHILYDEWDYKKRSYKDNYCKLYPTTIEKGDIVYYKKTLRDNRSTLDSLRKMLSSINNKYKQQKRQSQGEEFDLDAVLDLYVDIKSRQTPSESIYISKRKQEKDLSILLLLDSSLSSDGYAANNRVIDVEKQVSILFGEILNEYNIDFSINSFYSKTRNHSTFQTIKGFEESWNQAKYKIGSIEPSGYTRIGVALRHAGSLISQRPTKNKWIILLSDGKPNDFDRYEGQYGIHDIKQALRELNVSGINSYALAIEAQAKYYLPQMFGQDHYQVLTTPVELLQSLVKLYDKIKHQS